MEKILDTLSDCPLFSGISRAELSGLVGCLGAKVMLHDRNSIVFDEGSEPKYVGILLSGSAQLIQEDYYGNRSLIGEVHSPDVFGEAFACANVETLPLSVVASEPSEVMLIECSRILRTCSSACSYHHRLIYNLMQGLAEKTILLHRRCEITSQRTTRDKLLSYLMLYAKDVRADSFDIPFDRQELADYIEVDRSGLSREIGRLCREGVIECRRRHFRLLGSPEWERI